MKRSKKTISIILVFFLIIAFVIIGRTMVGNHFKKKFSKRLPPGIIVSVVNEQSFSNKINTFGTATPSQTRSYKVEKYEILTPIKFNQKVKKDVGVRLRGFKGARDPNFFVDARITVSTQKAVEFAAIQ